MADERKLVTILFADVTGWTALGEALDPEDARALASRYYQHARRVVAEHGGTLEKFIGDATMAVFGLPQAHGDDAERALAAALALRAAVAEDPLLAPHFVLHAGVNTGEVATAHPTADLATADSLVTGDAVNTAARLYDAAEPGEVLAGERTWAATEAAFLFGERRLIAAKNKRQPLTAYPLLAPRPARRVARPALVGRRRELAQLALLASAALEERHPQLVSIVAPAGTGKTRLLEEFLAGLDSAQGWQVATARCLPYGQSLTYWPLRGLLDDLLGAPFSPDLLQAAFIAGSLSEADAQRLAGTILASLGVEGASAAGQPVEQGATFAAWRLLIEALARHAPRIVIFEDLHWASDSLLDLVEHVMRPRTSAALLIIVLSRPELLDRRPGWGGGMRNFSVLALDALRPAQTRQLVDQLIPESADEAARERIVERAGGNPFFAIELSRGLAGRLEDGGGGGTDRLPETVHEAVLAQLDQLTESERVVLQVAAVAGRAFRPPTLRAALPERDPAAVASALEGLLARDVLAPIEGAEETYTFRHILFRDVAYGTLARAERVRLHLAVAGWLEGFAADRLDEFVELLAYHYREAATLAAQSVVPLNVAVDTERAVRYLVRAGEQASHVGLIAPAIAHLRAAISLAPAEVYPRLFEQLGDCANYGDVAVEGYQRALDLWRERGESDSLTGARLLRKLLTVYAFFWAAQARPSQEKLDALHAEALRLAERAGNEDELWRARIAPLNPYIRPGDHEDFVRERDICAAAVAYFERREDWPSLYMALDGYSGYASVLGDYDEALAAARRGMEWPDLPAWARGNSYHMIANAYNDRGDYDTGLAEARAALAQIRPGDPVGAFESCLNDALSAVYFGGHWSALDDLRPALALMWEEIGQTPGMHADFLWWDHMILLAIAVAQEDRAAVEAAAAALERSLDPSLPDAAARRGIAAAYLADDPARFDLDAPARESGFNIWAVTFLTVHGLPSPDWMIQVVRQFSADRDPIGAAAEALTAGDDARFAAAIDAVEARHMILFAARMRVALAQRTGDRAQLERARPVLERLGDRQFLRRLEEVEKALS
ncbi:MAG TPA: adenylate/guanylate cyclase domain-containing protein [Ktedonobacterales bacterium]